MTTVVLPRTGPFKTRLSRALGPSQSLPRCDTLGGLITTTVMCLKLSVTKILLKLNLFKNL